MKVAVVTEVSTKAKNKSVVDALDGRGYEVINAGMKGVDDSEPELTYIQTGFMSAVLIAGGCADVVVGGCGTGQGYLNSVLQYPGVVCGLVQDPLDAWLYRQINGGNCIALALNKGFGWASEENIRFIFDRFFSVESGCGYPEHRKASQQASAGILKGISANNHKDMCEIIAALDDSVILPALQFPGFMDILRKEAKNADIVRACENRLK